MASLSALDASCAGARRADAGRAGTCGGGGNDRRMVQGRCAATRADPEPVAGLPNETTTTRLPRPLVPPLMADTCRAPPSAASAADPAPSAAATCVSSTARANDPCDRDYLDRALTVAASPSAAVAPNTNAPMPAEHRTTYSSAERRRMRDFVTNWLQTRGPICVGYERPAHRATDIVADHVQGVARAGEGGPLRALCTACNRRRSGRQRR